MLTKLEQQINHERENLNTSHGALLLLQEVFAGNPHLALLAECGYLHIDYRHTYVHDGFLAPFRMSDGPIFVQKNLVETPKAEIDIPLELKPLLRGHLIDAGLTTKEPGTTIGYYTETFKNGDLPVKVRFYTKAEEGMKISKRCKIVMTETRPGSRLAIACPLKEAA